MIPAVCKGQNIRSAKIFYRNTVKCLKVFEIIRRQSGTSRDKGGGFFGFSVCLFVCLFWFCLFVWFVFFFLKKEEFTCILREMQKQTKKKEIKRKTLSLGQTKILQDKIPVTMVRENGKWTVKEVKRAGKLKKAGNFISFFIQERGEMVWRETGGDGRREVDEEVIGVSGIELIDRAAGAELLHQRDGQTEGWEEES